jgi:predicted nicotinamide N-methyase
VLKLADENIRNNLNNGEVVRTARLRWNTLDEEQFTNTAWDFVLASDVTYKRAAWGDLVHTISRLTTSGRTKTILTMEPRNEGEVDGVLKEAEKAGLEVEEKLLKTNGKSECNLECPRLFILSKQ